MFGSMISACKSVVLLKNPCTWGDKMYKKQSKSISFEDFNQPVGMTMSPDNRWVKKAEIIPWDEIEKEYAKLFRGIKGQVAKSARLALGALLIQIEYGYSDEETVEQIKENPYLQFFCGLPGYRYCRPFEASSMVRFRKRITPEHIADINERIIRNAEKIRAEAEKAHETSADNDEQSEDDHHDDDAGSSVNSGGDTKNIDIDTTETQPNSGTMIVDATCAPSRIKYPTDVDLLNTSREKLEKIIDALHIPGEGRKPRTYRRQARKNYLLLVRNKKSGNKKIQIAIKKQLQYVARDLKYVQKYIDAGCKLQDKLLIWFKTASAIYEQQKYMYDNKTHTVADRIVSFHQPFIRPIVRGKTKAPVEFGAKLDISVVNGMVRLEKQSFDAYNESTILMDEIENYHNKYGFYPAKVLADKIYRNRENLRFCKMHGIKMSGPALGRPKKNVVIDRKVAYIDECNRVEVERKFSLAKRCFSLSQIRTYLQETTKTVIALSILAMNLNKVYCCQILDMVKILWNCFMEYKTYPQFAEC